MTSGEVLEFDGSHHAVVGLLGLRAILVLPLARITLLVEVCVGEALLFTLLI